MPLARTPTGRIDAPLVARRRYRNLRDYKAPDVVREDGNNEYTARHMLDPNREPEVEEAAPLKRNHYFQGPGVLAMWMFADNLGADGLKVLEATLWLGIYWPGYFGPDTDSLSWELVRPGHWDAVVARSLVHMLQSNRLDGLCTEAGARDYAQLLQERWPHATADWREEQRQLAIGKLLRGETIPVGNLLYRHRPHDNTLEAIDYDAGEEMEIPFPEVLPKFPRVPMYLPYDEEPVWLAEEEDGLPPRVQPACQRCHLCCRPAEQGPVMASQGTQVEAGETGMDEMHADAERGAAGDTGVPPDAAAGPSHDPNVVWEQMVDMFLGD